MDWQIVLLHQCNEVLPKGGEVKILFKRRSGNIIRPEIYPYPDNQIICDEVEVEKHI